MFDSFWPAYKDLVTHIVPGPNSISYFIPFLLLPTAFCIPPHILSKWQLASLFLPLILACEVHAWFRMGGVDVISVNVATWSITLLLCYDPRQTFKRLYPAPDSLNSNYNNKHNDKEENHKQTYISDPYPPTLSARIPWVLTLLPSLRLSNWKTGFPSHDRSQPIAPLAPSTYLTRASLLALQSFIILDLTSALIRQDPYFHIPGTAISTSYPHQQILPRLMNSILQALPPRLTRSSILAAQSYALITQGGSLPTIPPVLLSSLGLWPEAWSPHTWPIFFGPFAAVWERGLKGLWGTWWHQTNRYLATPGRALAKWLKVKEGGEWEYTVSVVSAFGFSGVMHMGLVPPEPKGMMGARRMRFYVAAFFWVQALGIGMEVLVGKIFPRDWPVVGRMRKVVVFGWVALWLCYTLPILAVPSREMGYWRYPPLPVSLIGWFRGTGWWVWS
ncbi:MAG: hypothetical protein Q9222_006744 [Ikaeria aurantiellina]